VRIVVVIEEVIETEGVLVPQDIEARVHRVAKVK
jgi:hypothetical protein